MTKIKVCGITRECDVAVLNEHKPDYVGFVFAKSRRQISAAKAQNLRAALDENITSVGVFVNHDMDEICTLVHAKTIDIVQLHGGEDEECIRTLRTKLPDTKIIKAISVNIADDIINWQSSAADYLLLDNGAGGTGERFDWSLLAEISGLTKPYFIAGGLNCENIKQALSLQPFAVDVSSGVETDGVKDRRKITEFIKNVRQSYE